MLTPAQIEDRKKVYDRVIQKEGSQLLETYAIYDLTPHQNDYLTDYIGYLIYRALRLRQKYHSKSANIMEYMIAYHLADYSLTVLIKTIGIDSVKNVNASRMIERFLKGNEL